MECNYGKGCKVECGYAWDYEVNLYANEIFLISREGLKNAMKIKEIINDIDSNVDYEKLLDMIGKNEKIFMRIAYHLSELSEIPEED